MSRYVWNPGNGTRYELHVTQFEGPLLGSSDGGWVVVGPFAGSALKALIIPRNSGVHWSYVAEKMDISESDASCVTIMIGRITKVPAWPSACVPVMWNGISDP